eukprot:TRINITY_DN13768_c0_g1_i1.p1 TRINITY_DN13768_c0_g1~~TRINITY_DN13768_c0_g1_i1.p1  ORF type:complete len:509 (+),score=165.29 TRINITY_DN13768_c0_g1_i1:57-1529(+)
MNLKVASVFVMFLIVGGFSYNLHNSFAYSPARKVAVHQNAMRELETPAMKPKNVKDLYPTHYFDQELDHFDMQNQEKWRQRYWINNATWTLGGPIFVEIGGEGTFSSRAVTNWMITNYAKTYGALVVALEHRFYGESQPLPSLSTQNLRFLSSMQALADLANFITTLKAQMGVPDAQVVTFGGSYPGALSAWFRFKYPHITLGSVASSAPVFAAMDFYGYMDVVDKSLASTAGEKCDSRIQLATDSINQLLKNDTGRQKLKDMFQVCVPLDGEKDIQTFVANLMGNFQGVVQYNGEGNPITIKTVCDMMNKGSDSDALLNYAAVNKLLLKSQKQKCLDCSYASQLRILRNTTLAAGMSGMRQWTYQTCMEFGYFQTTDSPNQPFGDKVPLKYYTDMCTDIYGFDFLPRVNETNVRYGGKNPRGASNIDFVNGSIDPWHVLSITRDYSETVTATFVIGTAHCDDMSQPEKVPPQMREAQMLIEAKIGTWLF